MTVNLPLVYPFCPEATWLPQAALLHEHYGHNHAFYHLPCSSTPTLPIPSKENVDSEVKTDRCN